mgnify:CR=1 FL=1
MAFETGLVNLIDTIHKTIISCIWCFQVDFCQVILPIEVYTSFEFIIGSNVSAHIKSTIDKVKYFCLENFISYKPYDGENIGYWARSTTSSYDSSKDRGSLVYVLESQSFIMGSTCRRKINCAKYHLARCCKQKMSPMQRCMERLHKVAVTYFMQCFTVSLFEQSFKAFAIIVLFV